MSSAKETSILIVEDNIKIRSLIKSMLRSAGYQQITEAENGKQAWEMLQKNRFGLVLTDWMMPEMSGMDLLKSIRNGSDDIKSTKVVMITASDKSEDILDAAKWKINGYIVKPFAVKTVLAKIQQVISS